MDSGIDRSNSLRARPPAIPSVRIPFSRSITYLLFHGRPIDVNDVKTADIDARKAHPGQSLADLYDPDFMPQDLRKAHESLDKVVDVAFGAAKPCKSNDERLQILFDRYAEMTQEQ